MITYKKYIVDGDNEGIRVDRWLRRKFNFLPQSFFQKKLRKGSIVLNNKKVKANKIIHINDTIEIRDFKKNVYISNIPKKIKISLNKKENIRFMDNIIYENEDFLIFNKWNGIASQGGTKVTKSVDNFIKSKSKKMNLVHRLDKDTSGALIISKNYRTSRDFGELFKTRKVNKIYIALCYGIPKEKKGKILLKLFKNNNKNYLQKYKQESITRYELIEKKKNISLLAFFPLTGKKHQIRLAAKYLNCPILGDKKYNKFNDKIELKELMLHSIYLSFIHKKSYYKFFVPLSKYMKSQMERFDFKFTKNEFLKTISKIKIFS